MTVPDQSHINQVRDALWRWPIGGAPDCRDELVMLMRMGLVTEDADYAAHAAVGLLEWLRTTTNSSSQWPPPNDLVREMSVTIATRRKGMLKKSLQIADWTFAKGSPSQKNLSRILSHRGTEPWRETTIQ